MIVNIEFLDDDPIENAITCMNYAIDKTIFVGFRDQIKEKKGPLDRFLKKYCSVAEIEFVEVPRSELGMNMSIMRRVVLAEKNRGNQVFLDITGGDSITLVAFGLIARELDVPMHIYRVSDNTLIELEQRQDNITNIAEKREFLMTLDKYIELHGGVINYRRQKSYKEIDSVYNVQDVEKLWRLSGKHVDSWNKFSMFIAQLSAEVPGITVNYSARALLQLNQERHFFRNISDFNDLLDECLEEGLLTTAVHSEGQYRITFKNLFVRDCLMEAGSILELYIYFQHKNQPGVTDCRVGVHIDWDGVIIPGGEAYDVLNEIDVLLMKGNTPVFISCKNGNADQRALYELETVADRFGGRYAKKVLAVSRPLGAGHLARAEEMNIKVQCCRD